MADIEKLKGIVLHAVSHLEETPEDEKLKKIIELHAESLNLTEKKDASFTEEELESVARHIKHSFGIKMTLGTSFEAKDYKPWLDEKHGEIDWYYWKRYDQELLQKGFPPHVIRSLDRVTDKILNRIQDPDTQGSWQRRGMVVGHVQSGKTANYNGLICKAADAGYKVIIVLAGLINSLRNQTQQRIDNDFIGWCSISKKILGSGRHNLDERRRPASFTTKDSDFKVQIAKQVGVELGALKEPVIFVIKKNKSALENLYAWLNENNEELSDYPMLLIDDEADHGSVNTHKEGKGPTTINRCIRDLLTLFKKNCYVGYTATPFANIFIDPENEDQMTNGEIYKDLFPRDFILSLDPPDNYTSPASVFLSTGSNSPIRNITDNQDLLPVRHKIDFVPLQIPESLKEAIHCFILARAIRIIRQESGFNSSMMINVSRFTNVQNLTADLVRQLVNEYKHAITNYASLNPKDALQNSYLKALEQTWRKEFKESETSWSDVQKALRESIPPTEVIRVNSASTDSLNYDPIEYPNGRTVIAVGGITLSRGITLEGLTTSYFLRNSVMYDTLMQMGRWFGYRGGYGDLCRVFMTQTASSWYSHIADVMEELREDFKSMERAKLTPREFGLRVRSHPTALIVTARNKMRSARTIPVQIGLEGRLVETTIISGKETHIENNRSAFEKLIKKMVEQCESTNREGSPFGTHWESVPAVLIKDALRSYHNHPECLITDQQPLINYIEHLESDGVTTFDVLLKSLDGQSNEIAGVKYQPETRAIEGEFNTERIAFKNRRIGSRGDEKIGLSDNVIKTITAKSGKNTPDKAFRKIEGKKPLMILHFLDLNESDGEFVLEDVPVFGIGFQGDSGNPKNPERLISYTVTTDYWNNNYNEDTEEEE
jgi:hypothetical protein